MTRLACGDAAFTDALRQAQRAGVAFRDAHLKSVFPDSGPPAYGSMYPMLRCGVLEELTVQRTGQLRKLEKREGQP